MSGGKEDSSSLLKKMQQRKNNVRRSEREPRRNPRYEDFAVGGGRGRGRGRGRGGGAGGGLGGGGGGGGGGWGGPDFEPPPSASGDVASGFFLEGPSREEAETESRAEEDSSRGFETPEEDGRPKALKIRGEARVPDERKEPKTHEAKTLIIPAGPE